MTEGRLNLAESCTLEPLKRTESQIEQLYLSFFFAGGSNPLLLIRQQGGMFSPDGVFGSNICSAEVPLGKTLKPQ